MFKRVRDYIRNKGLCFTYRDASGEITVSVCNDLNASRIKTPYTNELIDGLDEIVPALARAYTAAKEAGDEKVMDEVHSLRGAISKAYG